MKTVKAFTPNQVKKGILEGIAAVTIVATFAVFLLTTVRL